MNRKLLFAVVPIFLLLFLGGGNIYRRIVWQAPYDGVTWKQKTQGLTAIHVEELSPAYLRGVRKGDFLYSLTINDQRRTVNTSIDVAKILWEAQSSNQPVTYEIAREGQLATPRISIEQKRTDLLYYYLALIGLTTLVIAAIVFLTSKPKRPFTLPFIFFFLVSLSFYAYNIFSPTGKMDLLDNCFYWLDALAFLIFPPLLLHFFIIFPRRKKIFRQRKASINILYAPAALLLLLKFFIHLPNIWKLSDEFIVRFYETTQKLDLLHFGIFSLVAFGVILADTLKTSQVIVKPDRLTVSIYSGLVMYGEHSGKAIDSVRSGTEAFPSIWN